jgi:hypothetical protein
MSLLRFIMMASICCTTYGSVYDSFTDLGLRRTLWKSALHSCIKKTGSALETVGKWGMKPACYFATTGGILWGLGLKADEWSNKAYYCDYPPGLPDETIPTMTSAGKYMFIISGAGVPLCFCLKSLGKRLQKYAARDEETEELSESGDEKRIQCTPEKLKCCGAVLSYPGRACWMLGAATSTLTCGILLLDGSVHIGKNTEIPGSCPDLNYADENVGDRLVKEYKTFFYALMITCGGKIIDNMGRKLTDIARAVQYTHYLSQRAQPSNSESQADPDSVDS